MFPARQAIALCQHYASEPTREGFRLMKLTEHLPCRDESLLCGIFSQMKVSQHSIRAGVSRILENPDELAKSLMPLCERGV
jgi:hypothetical protein